MKLLAKTRIGLGVLRARLLQRRIPLFVGWQLTARCNLRCRYCDLWKKRGRELTTEQVLSGIDQLAALGTKVVALSGGEPLLRDDLPQIIEHCHAHGITIRIHTNGHNLQRIAEQLSKVHAVVLSLDGPEVINDKIRGKGSYQETIEAAELARKHGTKVLLNATLTAANVSHVEGIIREAEGLNAPITFQPVIKKNPEWMDIDHLKPEDVQLGKAIGRLIWHKKQKGSIVGNSLVSLHAFLGDYSHWKGNSALGRMYIHISYDGRLYASCRQVGTGDELNIHHIPIKDAFARLPLPTSTEPHSALEVEMSLIYNLNPRALLNAALKF